MILFDNIPHQPHQFDNLDSTHTDNNYMYALPIGTKNSLRNILLLMNSAKTVRNLLLEINASLTINYSIK